MFSTGISNVAMSKVRKELIEASDRFPADLAAKVEELCRYSASLETKLKSERRRSAILEERIQDLAAIKI